MFICKVYVYFIFNIKLFLLYTRITYHYDKVNSVKGGFFVKLKRKVKINLLLIGLGIVIIYIFVNKFLLSSNIEFINVADNINMKVGEIKKIEAQFKKPENLDIIFSVDNSDILSVDKTGQLLAKKSGFTYIYAGTKDNEKQIRKRVEVNKDDSFDGFNHIQLDNQFNSILEVGSESFIKSKPDHFFNKYNMEYASSDSHTIDVDSNGRVYAKKAGNVKISVKIKDTDIVRELDFESKDDYIHVNNLSIAKNTQSVLETGETMKFSVNCFPQNADNKELLYTSSEPTIASISNDGVVTGLRPGLTTLTAVAKDNGKKVTHQLYISKSTSYLTKEMLNMAGINECNKLMIVAHPDDETLWGGGHLLRDKYFVLCLTNGFNEVRKNEYYKALEYSGNKGIILSYPDLNNKEKSNWEHNKVGARKDIDMVLEYKNWDEIATHSPAGETGHRHHKFTSELVTKSAKSHHLLKKLIYFGKFYEKGEVPKNLKPSLTQIEIEKKNEMLAIYKAETKSIDAFWRQMVPYEYWKKAVLWKKN